MCRAEPRSRWTQAGFCGAGSPGCSHTACLGPRCPPNCSLVPSAACFVPLRVWHRVMGVHGDSGGPQGVRACSFWHRWQLLLEPRSEAAGWSGDGSVRQGSSILSLARLWVLGGACSGVVGDRIRPCSTTIPLLQSHVLLRHAERSPGGARGGRLWEGRAQGPGEAGGLGAPLPGGRRGAGASPRCCIAAPSRERSAEGSWEGRGCCIAGLRLEAVQMEMCRCQGGCDTGERRPAHPRIRSPFL